MQFRHNQPIKTPGDRHFCASRDRLATALAGGQRQTKFVTPLPPGVLMRLLAHKTRLSRPAIAGPNVGGRQVLPNARPISRLKYLF